MEYLGGLASIPLQADNQGNNVIVRHQGAGSIIVSLAHVIADGAQQIKFISRKNGTGTDLTGLMSLDAGGGFSTDFNPYGHFQTAPGADLVLYLENADAPVAGWLNIQRVAG